MKESERCGEGFAVGDRNKEAADDAEVISSLLSGRVVVLCVETGKTKREKIWEETKIMYGWLY